MTERTFEELVGRWYRPRLDDDPLPERLRVRVLGLPEQRPMTGLPLDLGWRPRSAVLIVILLATLLLAVAMTAAGMVPRLFPDRTLAFPSGLDACIVLRDVADETRDFDHGLTGWSGHVCAVGWDGGWNDPHLLLRVVPTSAGQAREILGNHFNWQENARPSLPPAGDQDWPPLILGITNGTWIDYAQGVWMGCPAPGQRPFLALAVSAEPFFFIVTGQSSRVRQLASDVAQLLGTEVGVLDDLAAARPTCAPSP